MSLPMERAAVIARHVCAAPAANGSARFRCAVLGAAGGIGQPLSLLLKQDPLLASLHLYDIASVAGVAADVSHVDAPAVVTPFQGPDALPACLSGCDVVVIPAGIPRKPGMARDDLFKINAGIVRGLVQACARHCPRALLCIISNPVNSTVAIAAETLKEAGVYDPRRLFGVTTLDVVRANTFLAEVAGLTAGAVRVPVVGGHAGATILPLLSQAVPPVPLGAQEAQALTERVQNGGTEVVKAKAGAGSATLSMALAAARFAGACMRGLRGDPGVVECTMVASELTAAPFFASRVELGAEGARRVLPLGPMSEAERAGLNKLVPELVASINKGVAFCNDAAKAGK